MSAVFLHYDQAGLDAAYDRTVWAANRDDIVASYSTASTAARPRLGPPLRHSYSPTAIEALDIFRTPRSPAVAAALASK